MEYCPGAGPLYTVSIYLCTDVSKETHVRNIYVT